MALYCSFLSVVDMEDPYAAYEVMKRTWIPQMHRRALPDSQFFGGYNTPSDFRVGKEIRDDALEFLPQVNFDGRFEAEDPARDKVGHLVQILQQLNLSPVELQKYLSPDNFEKLLWLLNDLEGTRSSQELLVGRFPSSYNTPEGFREGWESRDDAEDDPPEPRIYIDEGDGEGHQVEEYGSGLQSAPEEIFRELKNEQIPFQGEAVGVGSRDDYGRGDAYGKLSGLRGALEKTDNSLPEVGMFTEGGVVRMQDSKSKGENGDEI